MKEDAVHQFLVTDNITFHFNPPSAPHFVGIWEATVKSFKFHLNRVVGVTSLTFEELSTLSSQIEACLNSRPLCVLSSSPDDPCVLTPGYFLIGKTLTATPQTTVPDDFRHSDRCRLLTRMTQHFWNRWSPEYLTLLQSKLKWRIVRKILDMGDLVLIKHDNSPPLQWKLGKVTETFPGKDGKVRLVMVKTQTSERLRRQLRKTCSFYVTRHNASRQSNVPSPSQEESILMTVAVRRESSSKAVARYVSVSHETICNALNENYLDLFRFQRVQALNPAGYLLRPKSLSSS
ncbi:integrase catalytic domain-containing protein [Trichonephila clavipes]|nr:integrase catalytic domain-containing protein [Trichonephila clavipes]